MLRSPLGRRDLNQEALLDLAPHAEEGDVVDDLLDLSGVLIRASKAGIDVPASPYRMVFRRSLRDGFWPPKVEVNLKIPLR